MFRIVIYEQEKLRKIENENDVKLIHFLGIKLQNGEMLNISMELTLTCVENVAIFIFWVHAVAEKCGGLVVAQLFTQGFKGVFQLSEKHCAVFFFVVQLETFHEVLVASLVLLYSDLWKYYIMNPCEITSPQKHSLVRKWEGILQRKVSSHHASLWLPSFRTIQ